MHMRCFGVRATDVLITTSMVFAAKYTAFIAGGVVLLPRVITQLD